MELFKEANHVLTLLIIQACLPQPLVVYSAPEYNAHVAGVTCSVLLTWAVSICDQHTAVDRIHPVSSGVYLADHPHNPGAGMSPLPTGWLKHILSPAMPDSCQLGEWNVSRFNSIQPI